MRSVNFRDGVLHAVAYKLGLDPDQSNFLTNQAIPIGTYIDEWVRRTYDARDWPEWTVTRSFTPINHVVPWDTTGTNATKIGRVLKVFLVDPATTDAPVETEFTLLSDGIHVGYDHGTNVWIRYIAPPPKFTAIQWQPSATYAVDDTVYSYTTGECYKSKVSSNHGHDPVSHGFSRPPPPTEITQPWTPYNPGIPERDKILRVYLLGSQPGPDPVDPPPANSVWEIQITDNTGTPVTGGSSSHVATGSESLVAILTDLYNQFVLNLPGGWTVTKSDADLTIDLQNASDFGFIAPAGFARWYPDVGLPISNLKVGLIQAYIPTFSAASGQPQITRITMSPETTFTGTTYELTITDSVGVEHTVEYVSTALDGSSQILHGLLLAIENATDTYFNDVEASFSPTLLTLDLSLQDSASVDVRAVAPGSAYWELVPFPKALAEPVIRGAYGDLLKEWGQTDKGAAEEQAVPAEVSTSEGDFTSTPTPALTGQQIPVSRYRVQ